MPSAATRLGSPLPATTRSPCSTPSAIGAGGERPRLVAIVPAELLGGGGQRHDLHVRRRHHQLAGVQRIQRLVGLQRLDQHAPGAVRERRLREDGVDVVLKRDEGREGQERREGQEWRDGRMGAARPSRRRAATAERQSISQSHRAILITSLKSAVSIFAAPGSPGRDDEDVVADLAERRPLFLLALVELHDDRHRRLVEAGLGRRVDERGGADVRQLAEQAVALVLVEIAGARAQRASICPARSRPGP